VTATGEPLETRKQLYGQAFAIYGLSEYYAASKFKPALHFAQELFQTVDKYGYDAEFGGYFEAFGTDWGLIDDLILSKMPWNKSQNTHLHLIEAFTNLYRVWPDVLLRERMVHLSSMFLEKLISTKTYRLRLFFDQRWQPKDETISYGHDIEASWLLWETAEVLNDHALSERIRPVCIKMAQAACTGLGDDGALNYEYDPVTNHLNRERSWWVLSEQMVGFLNAHQLTGETHFREKAEKSWEFIKKYVLDKEKGDWFGTVNPDLTPVKGDKVNFWKCPYHNSRACYEVIRRLS
jgi:cellobiose epimerase